MVISVCPNDPSKTKYQTLIFKLLAELFVVPVVNISVFCLCVCSECPVTGDWRQQVCRSQSTNQGGDVPENVHSPPAFESSPSLCMPGFHLGGYGEGHPEAGDRGGSQETAHPQRPTPVEGHWSVKIHTSLF